jgi:hypothetical protein
MALPEGLNATLLAPPAGNVAGLANLLPKPETDQEYTFKYGVKLSIAAIALPEGLNATAVPKLIGGVVGLAYFVPKPEPDQG